MTMKPAGKKCKKEDVKEKKKTETCIADEEDAASVAEDPSISVNCFALKLFASTSWKEMMNDDDGEWKKDVKKC